MSNYSGGLFAFGTEREREFWNEVLKCGLCFGRIRVEVNLEFFG